MSRLFERLEFEAKRLSGYDWNTRHCESKLTSQMSFTGRLKLRNNKMTQEQLANHDCKKGLEDSCTCDTMTDEEAQQLLDESIEADVEDLTEFDI